MLRDKLIESLNELKGILSKDKISETQKNFALGRISAITELLRDEKRQ